MFGCDRIDLACMKRLKRVSESTNPCGTRLKKLLFVDGVPLWTVVVRTIQIQCI